MSLRSLPFDRPLEPDEIEEIQGRVGYASADLEHFRIDPARPDRAEYALRPGADEDRMRALLCEVIGAIRTGMRRGRTRVIWDGRDRKAPCSQDVRGELQRRGLLVPLGRGQAALGGDLLLLAEGIDRAVLGIAGSWSPRRFDYPSLIPLPVLVRARYLESFPQYITFACHLREDLEILRQIVGRSSKKGDAGAAGSASAAGAASSTSAAGKAGAAGAGIIHRDHLGPLDHVLSPAVCLHAYQQLADAELPGPTAITARARCFRYEGNGLGGAERLWDFSMREIVFFGEPAWVSSAREEALARAIDLARGLELRGRAMTATDAFFVDGYSKLAAFQRTFDTKYELRLDLPGTGGSLAAASFNLHHDHFTRAFAIRIAGVAAPSSGCVGFGLERFAYAVACQHGPDPELWPGLAQELIESSRVEPSAPAAIPSNLERALSAGVVAGGGREESQ